MLVCLSTCGHGSGNGAPCAGRAICASFAPLGVYIYAVGVESCATRLPLLRSVPLPTRTVAALGTLGSSARCSVARPLSRSLRRRSRRLRGDTRRNASSVNTPPRLATCLTAHPTNRVAACRSVRHSPPRPLPHLPIGAYFFVVSALADVPSTRLTLSAYPKASREAGAVRGANPSRRLGRGASPRRPLPRQIRRVEPIRLDYHRYAKQSSAELIAEGAIS